MSRESEMFSFAGCDGMEALAGHSTALQVLEMGSGPDMSGGMDVSHHSGPASSPIVNSEAALSIQ